jgi:predicted ester cyclase
VFACALVAVVGLTLLGAGRLDSALAQEASPAAAGTPCPATTEPENEAIVLRYLQELLNGQNLVVVEEIFAADHIHHRAFGLPDERGIEARRDSLEAWYAGFAGFRTDVDDVIAEDDQVVVRYPEHGTHMGEWQGIAASGQPVTWTGIFIFRIECGRIAETWASGDSLGLLRQFGIISDDELTSLETPSPGTVTT